MQPVAESNEGKAGRRGRRRGRLLVPGILALAAAALVPYLATDAEPVALGGAMRASASGSFIRLSAGQTHYEVSGPDSGRTVVLVHGTTVPALVWDHNFPALAEAGFRVIRFDLYGRGLSDRPDGPYDLDVYVNQLAELLAQVAPGRTVDLMGLSLGGMIVAEFTRRYPERVRKLVLIGPGGIADPPLMARVASAPVAGEYIMRVAGSRQLLPSQRMLLHPENHGALDSAFLSTIRYEGSRRAVLRTLRNVPYNGYQDAYRELGELGKPTLLIWGRQDVVVPFANSEQVRALVRPARFLPLDDAGHLANYERPDAVNAASIEFLAR